jgi:hypothetical protein
MELDHLLDKLKLDHLEAQPVCRQVDWMACVNKPRSARPITKPS